MQNGTFRNEKIMERVLSNLPTAKNTGKQELLRKFIHNYYAEVDCADLAILGPEDLYGAAVAHWELALNRQSGETVIRVYNPDVNQHGWHSRHTIIELVTDDMPYLVASLSMGIAAIGLNIHLTVHPIMSVTRSDSGKLLQTNELADGDSLRESIMHIEVDRVSDEVTLTRIDRVLKTIIGCLTAVREQQSDMNSVLGDIQSTLQKAAESSDAIRESANLLEWMDERHFTVLGIAEFQKDKSSVFQPKPAASLGIMTDVNGSNWKLASVLPVDHSTLFTKGSLVSVSKANVRSPIVRPENLDIISIQHPDDQTRLHYVVGLFAPFVKNLETAEVPLLRQKTQSVQSASGLSLDSHSGKTLQHTLEQLPRDMLFQNDTDTLLQMATSIVNLQERQRIRLFGSLSPGGSYCNCLVYIPRERYSRELRLLIESILLEELQGSSSDFDSQFSSESVVARIHYVVQLQTLRTDIPNWEKIEEQVIDASITWDDRLLSTLMQNHDEDRANQLFFDYSNAFPPNYKESYSARIAYSDIDFIENSMPVDRPVMSFYKNILADTGTITFKLFSPNTHIALSDVIPVIENLGLRVDAEHPYHVKHRSQRDVWIHEFSVQHIDGKHIETDVPAEKIQDAFEKIWTDQVENDGFNRLILEAVIDWRQAVILRSYCKYLQQIQAPFSQAYMIDTLVSNAAISTLLISLFEQRFDPDYIGDRVLDTAQSVQEIRELLKDVQSLDQDRILRAYLNLITSTVRTNYYCIDENDELLPYVSYKIDSLQVKGLPLPRPAFEIFVYSPRVEGIHLRGGKVARGGLRWSDRREDFRTEILGLMKAQMVKNAVIVPVGSKGGFYVKRQKADADRESHLAEGVFCYQTFLRGLLDVTDNFSGDTIIEPDRVIRYDDNDPYLVVAADKGTATFSDYANAIALEYGFWLGDGFASGGSVGYDHKKMGITARGAWESVKRHFRELGVNTQEEGFTVVGIGDMAGDVFGNGMLLSEHIKLIAAFNHQHIFIDPTPVTDTSFLERKRLFELPRSSWTDYNESLLSKGGAIFSRAAKEITLSPEAMNALGIDTATMTPNELITCILMAQVDLLWNGGIGTYIKASSETQAQASDRANDGLRVNANQLRCRVIGEGGNLGCTQLGRIEFARQGGMIFTDAIDNSAGVDCSDHEVNIKILCDSIVKNGDMTQKQRDLLLASMTDDVGTLVLRDNYLQTQCINITQAQAPDYLEEHARFISSMEAADLIHREIEFLPDAEEIADRLANQQGLSRPEIAVIVSYSKMTLYDELLSSELPDDPALSRVLTAYFPEKLRAENFADIQSHRLRREIIATQVTNQLVNRLGPSFISGITEELGSTAAETAHAFVAVCYIFDMPSLWRNIEALDNIVSTDVQTSMHILVRGLVERTVHWLLRSRRREETIDELIAHFKPGVTELVESMPDSLASVNRKTLTERCNYFIEAGAPADTALQVARVVPLSSALDIIEISGSRQVPPSFAAKVYFELGVYLDLQWLRDEIGDLIVRTRWHTLAKSELRSDMHYQQRHLCAEVLSSNTDSNTDSTALVQAWADANRTAVTKYSALINDMKASSGIDYAMLSLAVNEVHKLLRSDRPLAS